MKKVYVCSPLSGDIQQNILNARKYCKHVVDHYYECIPICPHIYFTQFLNDSLKNDREYGIMLANKMLLECDYVYVFTTRNLVISDGMKNEINLAINHKIPIKYVDIENEYVVFEPSYLDVLKCKYNAVDKNDIEELKSILEYLKNCGLGNIYGFLGRIQAIANQLLNDNPLCYEIDDNGKRVECKLDKKQKCLISEIREYINQMLNKKDLYMKLENLISKYDKP